MRNMSRAALALTGAAALALVAVVPANAADDVTVVVSGGTLGVATLDAGAILTTVLPGVPSTGTLSTVTVTDNRAIAGSWDIGAAASAFETAADTVADASMTGASILYSPETVTTGGAGTSNATEKAAVTLTATPASVVAAATISGVNTATWDADLTVTIPGSALAGTYTATITHSLL